MADRQEQPIDPEKYKSLVPENPGPEEGVTAEVDALRRDHQLPDAEVDFESLAQQLANMDLAQVNFAVPQARADEDPGVGMMHQVVEQEFTKHDRKVDIAVNRESLASLTASVAVLGQKFDSSMSWAHRVLSPRADPEALEMMKTIEAVKAEAETTVLPLATAKKRYERSEISPVRYYEVIMLARDELQKLVNRLQKITQR